MKCIYCGGNMELLVNHTAPYPEPSEFEYVCKYCRSIALDNECYGVEWTKGGNI